MRAFSLILACTCFAHAGSASAQAVHERLTIVAPAAPGGGWDQTARAMQRALEADGLARIVTVENVPGAAGTIGLSQFVGNRAGDEDALLVTGLVMVGAILFNNSPVSLTRTTPIARLTGEYEVVVVPRSSPVRDMRDLVERFRAQPADVSWGGGSAGGTDHILAGLIADAAGIDPRRVNYIAFSGGGEAVAAILGGQVTAAISGYSEFASHIASGQLRPLAISSATRQPGIEAPTLVESGYDVSLANWRGVVAPPGINEPSRRRLIDTVQRMSRGPAWRRTLEERGWSDQLLTGAQFQQFMDGERLRVTRIARALRTSEPALASSARLFPLLVIVAGLVVFAALARQIVAEHRTAAMDTAAPRSDRVAIALTTAALLTHLVLLRYGGFVIASTAMFVLVAAAFAGRVRPRDLAIALAFSTAVYAVFTRALNLPLPTGWLGAWVR